MTLTFMTAGMRSCHCGDAPNSTSPQSRFQQGECFGYAIGADDGVRTAFDILNEAQPYCIPDGVTNGQIVRILTKFIKDHPEKAHKQTRVLVIESLMDAFPCRAKKK